MSIIVSQFVKEVLSRFVHLANKYKWHYNLLSEITLMLRKPENTIYLVYPGGFYEASTEEGPHSTKNTFEL